MGKKKSVFLISFSLLLVFTIFIAKDNFKSSGKIDKILKSEPYSYLSPEAKNYIKEVYENSGELILTEKNKKKGETYLNPQYAEYLSYSEEVKDKVEEIPVSMIIDYSSRDVAKDINVPSRYDLRNDNGNNYVTPVRDQGSLGICWTFATAGAAESYLLKTTNSSYTPSSQLFSERQIDYATSRKANMFLL